MKMSDFEDEPPPVLLPCSICTRTFRPEVLERHTKICEKSATKKRRPFDSFKSRVSGTELEEFLGPAALPGQPIKKFVEKSPQKKPPAQGPPKWKEAHERLIADLRAARGETVNVPNVNKHAGNEQCPSCGRYFGPRAFDRHVEFCKEKLARIKTTPSKASQAHERLEARIKYRAPLSLKPKLTTKEKYSPMLPRKADSTETCVQAKTTPTNSAVKTPKPLPSKTNVNQFTRQSPTRTSQRQRSVSPSKKSLVSSSKASSRNESSPMKPTNTPKIKDSLRETEDLRPKTTAKLTAQDKIRIRYSKINERNEDDYLVPTRSKTTSRSKTRDKRFPSSDEETEGKHARQSGKNVALPRAENLKTTSSRPIFQTDVGYRSKGTKESKKIREFQSSSEGDVDDDDETETVSSRSTTARKTCRNKTGKSFPVINDLSVNDETFGILVSPCSFGTKPVQISYKPPLNVFPDSKPLKKKEKSTLDVKTIPKSLPSPRREAPQRSPRKIPTSKIPKSIPPNKLRKEKLVEDSECVRKERERTATIKKDGAKNWKNLSEMSTDDLKKFSERFDDWPVGKVSQEPKNLSNSAIWEIAGEEFLNLDSYDSGKENGKTKCEDEIVVLHLTDPLKLSEKETDMKLSVSEPCLSPTFREKSPDLKSDLIVFTAVSEIQQTRRPARKKHKKPMKIRILPRFRRGHVREKTFLANGYPMVKRRKLNSEETKLEIIRDGDKSLPSPENNPSDLQNVEPVGKNLGADEKHPESVKPKKFEFFEIRADVEENKKDSSPVVSPRPPNAKKFDYFEITEEKPLKSIGNKKSKPKNNEKSKKAKKVEEPSVESESISKRTDSDKFELRYSDDESERMRLEKAKALEKPKKTFDEDVEQNFRCKFLKENSLENIQEAEGEDSAQTFREEIEIEDFIVSKPDRDKILSEGGQGLEELFPKPKKVSNGLLGKSESSTAVRLGYVVDSVYDLKSEKENVEKTCRSENRPKDRIFKKRPRNGMILPEIVKTCKEKGKAKNSIMSLVQIWKNKKEIEESDRGDAINARIPAKKNPKLAPLDKRNPYQIAVLPFVLRRKIAEVVVQVGCLEKGEKKEESYDPFKQAERQMMALLSWPSTVDVSSNNKLNDGNVNETNKNIINNNNNNKNDKPFPQPRLSPSRNLEASPTSAFSKYPFKDEKISKDANENRNKTPSKELDKNETYTYSAADDWEQIFEKHFDLNRNETMTEKMTKSVKSALDGLLKKSPKKTDLSNPSGKGSISTPRKNNRSDASENSVLDEFEMAFTSTPKESGSDSKVRGSSSGPKTYRKISGDDRRGRITPPEDFGDFVGKENRNDKSNRNSGVSLSSLSFCSQVSSDATIADDEVLRNNLEIIGIASPRNARKKFVRSQSVFDERNKMLFAKTFDRNFSSSDENEIETDRALPNILNLRNIKSGSKQAQPKSVPSSRFPRSQSVFEERRKGDGDHSDEGEDHVSSPDANKNRKAKMSGDSAYSSLNRKSPHPNVQPLNPHNDDRLSSSGSENSLPPLNNENSFKPRSLDFDALSGKKDQSFKMSKFCHECGSKYPVPIAKFCCECGVRRLII